MGILKPDVVLTNIEGFIALIAIIGGTAQPAFATMLELWKQEQSVETELHPSVIEAQTAAMVAQADHDRQLALKKMEHEQILAAERQQVELGIIETKTVLKPIKKKGDD